MEPFLCRRVKSSARHTDGRFMSGPDADDYEIPPSQRNGAMKQGLKSPARSQCYGCYLSPQRCKGNT